MRKFIFGAILLGVALLIGALLLSHSKSPRSTAASPTLAKCPVVAPRKEPLVINEDLSSRRNVGGSAQASKVAPSVAATVEIQKKTYNVTPNSIGMYPCIDVQASGSMQVTLSVKPTELIGIQVLDGGQLTQGAQYLAKQADDNGHCKFDYQVRKETGSYRVAIYSRGTRQILNFKVPPL